MTSLADSFRSGSGRKTKWQGKTVHSLFQRSVKAGEFIEIKRISASGTRAQAICLALDKGDLRTNGVLMESVSLWSHTSPDTVRLEIVGRKARSVEVWNSWSFEGVESAWLASAGMVVDEDGDVVTFRCSDGLGNPSFDDLVVELRFGQHA